MEIPVAEVPVNWQEIEGSKFNVALDLIKMARDYFMVRVLYAVGIWSERDTLVYVLFSPGLNR